MLHRSFGHRALLGAAALICAGVAVSLGQPASAAAPRSGEPAPSFTLAMTDASSFSLAATRGHVVVLNFFATWCPPCRAETPDLIAVERRYASRGVIFIGIDDSENAQLVSVFAKSKGIRYPLVIDAHGSVSKRYDVRAIPTTYVLDRQGVIRYRQVDELDAGVLSGALDAVLASRPVPESEAAQNFRRVTTNAAAQIVAGVHASTAATAPDPNGLDAAIRLGVNANKQLDGLLAKPDATTISYFDATALRDDLNAALADAYAARAAQAGSTTEVADRTEEALLRGQILTDREQFALAAKQFDTAMQLAPKDTRGYDGGYLAAYELRDYARAAEIASAEALVAPDDPESWLTVSSSQNSLKNYPAALEAQRKALALASQAYAKDPTSGSKAYEFGRVWLKMARTQILAGNPAAARPLLAQAQAVAPGTIVAQQASEQYVALVPAAIAIDPTPDSRAKAASAASAKVYVIVRNPSAQKRTINLSASNLPRAWVLSFCYSTVCNPYRVSFDLPARGSKRVELLVAPLARTDGPWSLHVDAWGGSTARVHVDANHQKAAITISAT